MQSNRRGNAHLKLVLLFILVASLGLHGAWSYSSATVRSSGRITITESENALVAVSISATAEHPAEALTRETGISCGTVVNNTPHVLSLSIEDDVTSMGGLVSPFRIQKDLYPGESAEIRVDITDPPGSHQYFKKLVACWDGGQAQIRFTSYINVKDPDPVVPLTGQWSSSGNQLILTNQLNETIVVSVFGTNVALAPQESKTIGTGSPSIKADAKVNWSKGSTALTIEPLLSRPASVIPLPEATPTSTSRLTQ